MKNKEKVYTVATIVLIIDQIVKLVVKNNIDLMEEIEVIPKFFSICYLENDGAAFSVLSGKTYIFVIVGFILLFMLDRFIKKERLTNLSKISLGIIIGGIVGNLVDRLLYHSVIDFLSFNIFGYSFPVFNIADIGITVGVGLYIIENVWRSISEVRSRNRRKIKNR